MFPAFHHGSLLSVALFLLVLFSVIGVVLLGAFRVSRKTGLQVSAFLFLWVSAFSLLVASGIIQQRPFPLVGILFGGVFLAGIAFGLSSWGQALSVLPIWQLALFQAFRLPLEVVLHLWAGTQTVPETMTWTGQNVDIISGILAALFLFKPLRTHAFAWILNGVGIVLLLNVVRVVVMSSPFPFAWELEHPLQLIFYLPYALIGPVLVWAAIAGHVVLTRALLSRQPIFPSSENGKPPAA